MQQAGSRISSLQEELLGFAEMVKNLSSILDFIKLANKTLQITNPMP
jgi:hypothetical protein